MKKYLTFFAFASVMFLGIVSSSYAAFGLTMPFGGRILTTMTPGVTCAAQYGIISIQPVGTFPPAPYIIHATTKTIHPGGWILGMYSTVMDPASCQIQTPTGPIPVPTFTIVPPWGASK